MERTVETATHKHSRFELAPPRRFILPAILLLLSEQPSYGYRLVPELQEFHFGRVDRPAVYRALAQLEHDGLVESSSQNPKAGAARRVYRVAPLGERVLREWMAVVREEHDYLGQVLRRYQATGTTDAMLAEIEGGWEAVRGGGWSPVSSSYAGWHRPSQLDDYLDRPTDTSFELELDETDFEIGDESRSALQSFRLIPSRSVVLIEVRSNVGPLSFGAIGVAGSIRMSMLEGVLDTAVPPSGRLEIDLSGLSSGNSLYDAELLRRIDARRFPTATVELTKCLPGALGSHYRVAGELAFHGMSRPAYGTVSVETISERSVAITGEQVFDMRDFDIPSPTVLMLRIYPDVRVRLHAEAELERER
jgi:PadR family transcriptional regulator, regulatory protein PadR